MSDATAIVTVLISLTNVNIDTEEIREALENNFMDFGEAEEDEDDGDIPDDFGY